MHIETCSFREEEGWSAPFPDLDSPRTLVLAFAASAYADRPAPFRELARAFPEATILGCSTAGEILDAQVTDESLAVAVVRFAEGRVAAASAPIADAADSHLAGRRIAHELSGPDLRGILVLSKGTQVNGTALAAGISQAVGSGVVVTGGLAGDGTRFQRTFVLDAGRPCPDRVVAAGIYGENMVIGHGYGGGWDIFGPERLVTRSAGSILYELDGRPALALYREYLGDLADGLPATGLLFPLSITPGGPGDCSLVRTILAVDEATQSLVFAGDIPQGWRARLMQSNPDRLVDGAEEAAAAATRPAPAPSLAIAVSCVGRRLVLGERTEEEVEATLAALPPGTRQVGFYSYGELAPAESGECDLHNQTMTLTTLSEV
ncbi:MAG: hypothetical protein FJW79_05890 [Actinobacteria bacterium]|nr:hypothetical protein [Actinomycetota bacterium]